MLQYFLAFSEYPTFTDLIRKHTIECIYQTKILETRAMTVASGLHPKKNWRTMLRKFIERKIKTRIVVPNVIEKSKTGTNYIFCALMQLLIWFEVSVWISAHLRFHKKIFWIDFESEISKVEVNFSVKLVRELKCSHNFRIRQQ